MEFFMAMIPPTATHQEHGHRVLVNGAHQIYRRGNGDAEAKLLAHLAKHIPPEPYTVPIRVVVKWLFPIKGQHRDGEWYANKPDVDNLCKSLYDIMTKLGYWKDDKQIVSAITEKFWAACPGIWIRIEEV